MPNNDIHSMAELAEELLEKKREAMRKAIGSASSESTSERFRDRGWNERGICPRCGGILFGSLPICTSCLEAERLVALRARIVTEHLRQAGLLHGPAAHMRFDTFKRDQIHHRKAYEVVAAWLSEYPHEFGESVLLWSSGFGTGKTHLTRAVQRCIIEAGGAASFWLVADMLAAIRASYDGDSRESEHAIVGQMAQSALLIWDDLGKEYVSERGLGWFQGLVFRVVDQRYREGHSMLITSNVPPDELGELIGGASASRLWEMVDDRVVDMTGPDWRMR